MQFNFVVGWHALNNGKEKAIARFSKLETAEEFVMYVVCDYLSNGLLHRHSGRKIYSRRRQKN